ncbi:MAG: hypothetical protein R3F19_00440 [Verrucomicrobiales bacterium]
MSKSITHRFLILSLAVLSSSIFSVQAQDVLIPDPKLRAAVLVELGKSDGDDITIADLTGLKRIVAPSAGIRSYEGMQHSINLEHIDLSGNDLVSIFFPEEMLALRTLNLSGNGDENGYRGLTSVALPNAMPLLEVLDLSYNRLQAIHFPEPLPNLKVIHFSNNPLGLILWPEQLPALEELRLASISMSFLDLPAGLDRLRTLDISGAVLEDYSVLNSLNQITNLSIGPFGATFPATTPEPVINRLSQLESLRLNGVDLESFFDQAAVEALSAGLKELVISTSGKVHLPDQLKHLTRLTVVPLYPWADYTITITIPATYLSLEEVRLEGNVRLSEDTFPAKLPNLRSVFVTPSEFGLALPDSLPELEELDFAWRGSVVPEVDFPTRCPV